MYYNVLNFAFRFYMPPKGGFLHLYFCISFLLSMIIIVFLFRFVMYIYNVCFEYVVLNI